MYDVFYGILLALMLMGGVVAVICFDVMRGDLSGCDALGCNAV